MSSSVPKSRRIAVLAHLHHPIKTPYPGGMESHTAHLVQGLAARGHEVTLFAKEGSELETGLGSLTINPVLDERFRVRGYPDQDRQDLQHSLLDQAMQSAIDQIELGDFDFVINNSLSPVPLKALPHIPTLHLFHTPPLPRMVEALQGRITANPVHVFATVSDSNAKAWDTHLKGLRVIANGIDLTRWQIDQQLPVDSTVAAWTGRITPEKGLHLAIEAARLVGMKVRFAGPVSNSEYFRVMIKPRLGDDVEYLGHLAQEDLRELIGSAQVFVSSPLWEEPFGLTTLEAMATGTPVATFAAGAMPELIGSTGGSLADSYTAEALGEAIIRAQSLNRSCVRERAMVFSHQGMLSSYEAVMQEIIGRSAIVTSHAAGLAK